MRMATTFGFNQVISHGFGLFLFAAIMPMMQSSMALSSWHLAAAGALTQLSYLSGAMALGIIGHRFDSGRLLLTTGAITTLLLFTMAWLNDPLVMIGVLTVLAASAAISWGSITELTTSYGDEKRTATNLSIASSGTAWGYSINGLILLVIVPVLGWRSGWIAASVMGLFTLLATVYLLKQLRSRPRRDAMKVTKALSTRELFAIVLRERTAFLSCLMLFMVGCSTMTFSTWLNTFLSELHLPAALGGYTWSVIGFTGMVAGFFIGKMADKRGHGLALLLIFGMFAFGLIAFTYDPAQFVMVAGFGYGLMYFPLWGVVSGWVSRRYSSKSTMQINGIGMVTFGMGGALGNLLAGIVNQHTGSLMDVFWMITAMSMALFILATYIYATERQVKRPIAGTI